MKRSSLWCLLFFYFIEPELKAQLQVTAMSNADSLASMLAGPTVVVSNAILNCPSNATPAFSPSGTFDGSASNIGINSGVLLTTGHIGNAVGPNAMSSITANNNNNYSDPDLVQIEPLAIHDACILEFTAKPSCDSIYVKFVFGSDEYPEFVGAGFNDAFGIFVTGPNPLGPSYSGYNMTHIPNTTSPVSINAVNNGTVCPTTGPCVNCAFYFDNCSGTTVEYDGFTTVIQKNLRVAPFQPYQFKFAIADAGDGIFDSGVFFGLGSFSCLGGVGVQESGFENISSVVSPNPFGESAVLTVHGAGQDLSGLSLRIFDVCGNEIRNTSLHSEGDRFRIERNGLSAGIYFYSVESAGKIISRGKMMME